MPRFTRILAVGSATLALAGITAGGAAAVGYNGGPFTTATSNHTFNFAGFDVKCSSSSAGGNASGSATLPLTMSFAGCKFFGLPATVTTSAPWVYMLTGGAGSAYSNDLLLSSGTTTTITSPTTGCVVTILGGQSFTNSATWFVTLTSENQTGGVKVTSSVPGMVYSASGCPFSSAANGQYTGTLLLPGIAIY